MADPIVIRAIKSFHWQTDEPSVVKRSYNFTADEEYTLPYEAGETPSWPSLVRNGQIEIISGFTFPTDSVQTTITVAGSNADFTTIQAAIDFAAPDASITNPYVVYVYPGIYNEQLTFAPYVHLFGFGQNEFGPSCVVVKHTNWVLKTATTSVNNFRFELLAGGTDSVQKIIDGQAAGVARCTFDNCYFQLNEDHGAHDLKLVENNASGDVVLMNCSVYFRPTTTGNITVFHSLSGTCNTVNLHMNHYKPTAGFTSCVFWLKDYAGSPDEINGIYFSREMPNTGSPVLFKNTTTNNIYAQGIQGLHFATVGSIVVNTNDGFIIGPRETGNHNMAADVTVIDGDLACDSVLLSTPALGSSIIVTVNGVRVSVADPITVGECYFSSDGGTTAKYLNNVITGDGLYWNGSVAGYQLTADDLISIDYTIG